MDDTLHIGFSLFPRVTQLDLTSPAQVLSRVPNARVHLVWKTTEPVPTDVGFSLVPTTTFADCPPLHCAVRARRLQHPDQLEDDETLAFLRRQGAQARCVTSVAMARWCRARPAF
jgi:cyclohexyl-isocyanide hydratase